MSNIRSQIMASKRSADASVPLGHASKRNASISSMTYSRPASRASSMAVGSSNATAVNNIRAHRQAPSGSRKPLSAASPNEIPTFRSSSNAAINDIKASMRPPSGIARLPPLAPRGNAGGSAGGANHSRSVSSSSIGGRTAANGLESSQEASTTHTSSMDSSSGNIRVVVRCR